MTAVIFDLDGSFFNVDHRLHYIDEDGRKNWKKFFNAWPDDTLNEDVYNLYKKAVEDNKSIIIVTGRPMSQLDNTREQLKNFDIQWNALYMRADDDYRKAYIIKKEMLDNIRVTYVVDFAVEDQEDIINMYTENDVKVIQVKDNQIVI